MGWVKQLNYEHQCYTPMIWWARWKGYGIGSIWQCDFCTQHWTLKRFKSETFGDYIWFWKEKEVGHE